MQEKLSKKNIGLRIKELRKQHKLSQSAIADKIGISRSNYSQIEIGNQYPTYEILMSIASYYSKSFDWLLCGSPETKHLFSIGEHEFSKEISSAVIPDQDKIVQIENFSEYVKKLAEPQYLSTMPTVEAPIWLINHRSTLRSFIVDKEGIIKGLHTGDEIIARKLTNYSEIVLSNEIYIIVTNRWIHICRVKSIIPDTETIICEDDESTNNNQLSFAVRDIQEIWKAEGKISKAIKPEIENLEKTVTDIEKSIDALQKEIAKLSKNY